VSLNSAQRALKTAQENAELREQVRRLSQELLAQERQRSSRCIYCGEPTRSKLRVCSEHRDIVE